MYKIFHLVISDTNESWVIYYFRVPIISLVNINIVYVILTNIILVHGYPKIQWLLK